MNRLPLPYSPLRRWWRQFPLLLAALALLAAAGARAQEDPPGRVGRLSETQGSVWLYDTAENEWVAALRNRPIVAGDRLATDAGARAEVQIGSNTLRLDGGSQLTMRALDDERIVAGLERGTLALRARSSEVARELSVETPAGRALPQRAGHYRVDVDERSTVVGAWSGTVRFDAPDSALDVQAGQRAEFWREGSQTHYTWAQAERDTFTDWVLAQDRADESRLAALGRDISPELTGVDELGRYGQWDSHPEYGNVWYPNVSTGWAPYRAGQWLWIAPWGWTWVDDAPWGFAPFHYGRWVQFGGRWAWAPGRYVSRPVYAPALVGWIGGGNVSVGVGIGGPPYVGWVPLAPREPYVPSWRYAPRHRDGFDPWYGHGRPPSGWRPAPRPPGSSLVNERVPGGLTLLPSDGFRNRQPIGNRYVSDPRELRDVIDRRREPFTPPPPVRIGVRPDNDDRRANWPDRRRDDHGTRGIDTGRPWNNDGRRDDREHRDLPGTRATLPPAMQAPPTRPQEPRTEPQRPWSDRSGGHAEPQTRPQGRGDDRPDRGDAPRARFERDEPRATVPARIERAEPRPVAPAQPQPQPPARIERAEMPRPAAPPQRVERAEPPPRVERAEPPRSPMGGRERAAERSNGGRQQER